MLVTVDGAWKLWSDWQACNETCGGGWQIRTRECEDPEHGGEECHGPPEDIRQCNTHPCPGERLGFVLIHVLYRARGVFVRNSED